MPATPFATTKAGLPVQTGDTASVSGLVTAVSGSGPSATLTVLLTSGGSVSVKASDVYATQSL